MDNKVLEIFIPGPAGRLEAKYFKSKKNTSPIALVLQPHPQYGGTMNNKVVVETFNTFVENDFSVCRVNFRGVGKSDGEFDNCHRGTGPRPVGRGPALLLPSGRARNGRKAAWLVRAFGQDRVAHRAHPAEGPLRPDDRLRRSDDRLKAPGGPVSGALPPDPRIITI